MKSNFARPRLLTKNTVNEIRTFEGILELIRPFSTFQFWVCLWIMVWLIIMGQINYSVVYFQIRPPFECADFDESAMNSSIVKRQADFAWNVSAAPATERITEVMFIETQPSVEDAKEMGMTTAKQTPKQMLALMSTTTSRSTSTSTTTSLPSKTTTTTAAPMTKPVDIDSRRNHEDPTAVVAQAVDSGVVQTATQVPDPCFNYKGEKCQTFKYFTDEFLTTMVTDWDLVCDKGLMVEHSMLAFAFGVTFGMMLCGYLADKYGRRTIFVMAMVALCGLNFAQTFVTSYYVFVAIRFFLAFCTGFIWPTSFVLVSELTTGVYRSRVGGSFWLTYSLGATLLTPVAYWLRDWRSMHLASSIMSLISLVFWWIIPESPRWLLVEGKVDRAAAVLKKAAKWNRVQLPANLDFGTIAHNISHEQSHMRENKGNLFDIFKHWTLVYRTVLLFYIWFSCCLTYYGITFYSAANIKASVFVINGLIAAVEIPGFLGASILLMFLPRKWSFFPPMCFGGMGLIILPFISNPVIQTILAMAGKLGVCLAWACLFVHTTEMYPTVVRTSAVAIADVGAGVGGLVAPYIAAIGKIFPNTDWLSMVVVGAAAVLAALLSLLLPETRGKQMPDYFEDVLGKRERAESEYFEKEPLKSSPESQGRYL